MSYADPEVKMIVDACESMLKSGIAAYAGELGELQHRIKDIEQATAGGYSAGTVPGFGGMGSAPSALASQFAEHDGFKAFASGNANSAKVLLEPGSILGKNVITGTSGSPAEPDSTIVQTQRMPGIVPGTMRRLALLEAINVMPAGTTNLVEYPRESAFSDGSAPQAGEGTQFGESDISFELAEAPVITIGTFLKTSTQVLQDQPALQRFLEMRLRHAVRAKVESQVIGGSGTGQNLLGLTQTGQHIDYALADTGDNMLATLRRARAQLENTDYMPSVFMVNPLDMASIDLLTDGQGGYLVGEPRASTASNLWQLPVVVSPGVSQGDFLCADGSNIVLWERQGAEVQFFTQDSDNATKGLVTVLATVRVAFSVLRPAGVVYGQF